MRAPQQSNLFDALQLRTPSFWARRLRRLIASRLFGYGFRQVTFGKNTLRTDLEGHASAVLAASIFHFGTYTIGQAKAHMAAAGIPVRLS